MASKTISAVVIAYDIARELPRTLHSLSASYQRGIEADEFEIIVVDNGSSPPVDPNMVAGYGRNFRLLRIDDASSSPAAAINLGIAQATGDYIGVFIDGARIATPGMLRFARVGLEMSKAAVVCAPGWYLGSDFQGYSGENGYSKAIEDQLLERIEWPQDGYRLFEISTMDQSSVDPWFRGISEANALFLNRENWQALGGFDERFEFAGGGLVNLDTLERAMKLPGAEMIMLLGEATFHQFHGGVATNATPERQGINRGLWKAERDRLRPIAQVFLHRPTAFVGAIAPAVVPHLTRSAIVSAKLNKPVEGNLIAQVNAPGAHSPSDPVMKGLAAIANRAFASGYYAASAEILRMASARGAADFFPSHLLSNAASLTRYRAVQDATHFCALGDAYALLGDIAQARQRYLRALEADRDCVRAHVGLANLRMGGPSYYEWIVRLYSELKPDVVVEIGVFDGMSLSKVTAPTLAIGIDPKPRATFTLSAETHIFPETSDAFFARRGADTLMAGRRLGVGFIDGLHTFDQVLRDFVNLENLCDRSSVILIHDTAALDEATQTVPPTTQFHTGDVWKIVPAIKTLRPELDIFTIATPMTGLTAVCGFSGSPPPSSWIAEAAQRFGDLPFGEIADNLNEVLSLVPNEWEPVLTRLRARGVKAPAARTQPSASLLKGDDKQDRKEQNFIQNYLLKKARKIIRK